MLSCVALRAAHPAPCALSRPLGAGLARFSVVVPYRRLCKKFKSVISTNLEKGEKETVPRTEKLIRQPTQRITRHERQHPRRQPPREPPNPIPRPNDPKRILQSPRLPNLPIPTRAPRLQQRLRDVQRGGDSARHPAREPAGYDVRGGRVRAGRVEERFELLVDCELDGGEGDGHC